MLTLLWFPDGPPASSSALEFLGVEDPERDPPGVMDRVTDRVGDHVGFDREVTDLAVVCLEPRVCAV